MSAINKTKQASEEKHHDLEDIGVNALKSRQTEERLKKYAALKLKIRKYELLNVDENGARRKGIAPEDLAVNIQNGIFEINDMLNEIAAPFGAAGDTGWFAEARMGWQVIYTQTMDMAETLFSLLELKDAEANARNADDEDQIMTEIKESSTLKEIYKILAKKNPLTYLKDVVEQRILNSSKMSLVRSFYAFTLVEYKGWAQFMHDICWNKEATRTGWAVTVYQPPQMPMGRMGEDLGNMTDPNNSQTY